MTEGVTCERCVVCFDVQLEILIKTVLAQEGKNGCSIEVILVLGRFLGLGFDVVVAFKADLAAVVDSQAH